ncbi:hypothetical protein [Promicromonospora panici]|uniref:hypothetical protein n=1 Tax=Promicromonospora panici TaxID=2219658 RepID=UPI001F5CFC98|nr:hypothetical protein [Promicromonospora panici]
MVTIGSPNRGAWEQREWPGRHTPHQAVAVALGLVAAASGSVSGIEETSLRALLKLEQTLPSRLRHRVDVLRSATVTAAAGGPTVDARR